MDYAVLPNPPVFRWTKALKAAVVKAINDGDLTYDRACKIYDLSLEEVEGWVKAVAEHGTGALRVTHVTRYRRRAKNKG